MKKPKDVDEYFSHHPIEVRRLLEQVRATIRKAAPRAEEVISYGIPAFKMNGIVVYYAAHSKHIGLYPMASGVRRFKKELSVYKGAKGSVQFPFDKPLPLALIGRIVKFRVAEDLLKAKKNAK